MNTASTLTKDVTARLQAAIEQGEYGEKSQLPSERELAEKLGVSRVTIRRALKELELTRIIHRRGTSGTFVSPRSEWEQLRSGPIPHLASDFLSASDASKMPATGLVTDLTDWDHIVELEAPRLVAPNDYLEGWLDPFGHAPVLRRLRLVTNRGSAFELWDTYYPESIFEGMLPALSDTHAIDRWLRERYGSQRMRIGIRGQIRLPTAHEAYWLRLSKHEPVADLERRVTDQQRKPITLSRIVAPTQLYSFGRQYEEDGLEPASWSQRASS